MKPLQLSTLKRWFDRECDRGNIDPQEIDFESVVDPMLTYFENKALLRDQIKLISPGTLLDELRPMAEDEYRAERAAREQFRREYALTWYILCQSEGETVSREMGPPIKRRFSLADYILFWGVGIEGTDTQEV